MDGQKLSTSATVQNDASVKPQKQAHPTALYLCGLTNMWERFAYYGVRSTLVLFLTAQIATGGLGFTKADAASFFGTYAALTYLSPLIGGWICDKYIGARYCIIIGSLLMAVGYIVAFMSQGQTAIYTMMIFVVIGTGFFKGNLNTLVGNLYGHDNSRKDGAFSIMYSFVNVGAMFGPLVCGLLANEFFSTKVAGQITFYGYKYVFLAGAVASLLTTLTFVSGIKKYIGDIGKVPAAKLLQKTDSGLPKANAPLTKKERERTLIIILISFFSIFFWAAYNQAGTSIALYTNDFINMNIGSFAVPVQWLDAFNGFLCIVLGPIMSAIWLKFANTKRGDLSIFQKMSLGFIFLAGGFLFMIFAVMERGISLDPAIKASVIWVLLFYVFQSIGEMCFSPIGNSAVAQLAPTKYASLLMGAWFLSIFFASKLAGYGQALIDNLGTMQVFTIIPALLVVIGGIILFLNRKLVTLIND